MFHSQEGTLRGAKEFFVIMTVCTLVIALVCAAASVGCLRTDRWEYRETAFGSISYEQPERFTWLPEPLRGLAQFFSWDDGEDQGTYTITDAEGRQWTLGVEDGFDTGLFYEQAQPGDVLLLWTDGDSIEAMTCGGTVYRSYEDALNRARSEGITFAVLSLALFVTAAVCGRCLFRLHRGGEDFRKKLPKWVQEA